MVADLLTGGGREWNFEVVRDIFSEDDANIISGIHLSHRSIPDKLIWKESSIGLFTVKSAYYVARRILSKEVHHQALRNKIWSSIWKAKVVPKVKFFTWRMVQGILPTGSALLNRRLQVNNQCSVCGCIGDTPRHIFFECSLVSTVWQLQGFEFQFEQVEDGGNCLCWNEVLKSLQDSERFDQWLITCWLIWNNRNQCFHNQICKAPQTLVRDASRMKEEFRLALPPCRQVYQPSPPTWSLPISGSFKLNVDATFNADSKIAGLGMVLRDSSSNVMLSAVTKIDRVDSPLHAEIKAILFGMEVAWANSFSSLIVESDSLIAIQEISKNQESFCEWESIISDIMDLSLLCSNCSFHSIKRSANMCAHDIAKVYCELGSLKEWRNSLPPYLCNPDIRS